MAKVLATDVHLEDGTLLPKGSTVPKKFADQVTNPGAYVDVVEEEPDSGSENDGKGYADQTVEQLTELLKQRELPTTGNKPDLIARLEESDQEEPDSGSEN